ncbi:MAG TPA: glycosyltransferase [Candidatus Hydrogenedens sp.]|nr:glycosyltransferase [Candidatus Hydrogenedens sp.]
MSINEIHVSIILVGENLSVSISPWFLHLENQDYPLSKVEWIIIEISPSEKTKNIISSLAKGSPLIVRYLEDSNNTLLHAWNLGFHEARGKWILCSSPNVLPISNWIQRHVQLQIAYNGNACVSGVLRSHPRISKKSITPWLLPEDNPPFVKEANNITPFHFSLSNMSVPREAVISTGGLNKSFSFPEFAEVELVKRLSNIGYPLCIDEQAICWFWKGSSYVDACKYHYCRGYSMGCFLRLFPDNYQMVIDYKLHFSIYNRILNSIIIPYYHRICLKLPEDSKTFSTIYRRVFRYWRYRGFSDAIARREPQIDIIPS